MNRFLMNVLPIFLLAFGSLTGCVQEKTMTATNSVWRASNDNGDKPGSGIELTLKDNLISGRFFLLEPEKAHDFIAGRAFPMKITERTPRELFCEVRFSESQLDKFVLKLPPSFPQNQFIAVMQDPEPGTSPIEFNFKSQRCPRFPEKK